MADGDILYEQDGDIAIITLNRPHRMNALPLGAFTDDLAVIWEDFDRNPDLRVAILTATGDRAFCSGVDVRGAAEARARGEDVRGAGKPMRASPRQNNVRKPVICAVNGLGGGGGLMLVADSDVTIAGPNAAFFNPGVGVGIVALVCQVTWANSMPFHANMRMALMGPHERVSAERALELGLVTEVVHDEPLLDRAKQLARTMSQNSPIAMTLAKQILWAAKEHGLTEARAQHMVIGAEMSGHPDQAEGPRAFAEKRRPNWMPLD
jgi:enoyl-CoA hydratase/carnithine racemase